MPSSEACWTLAMLSRASLGDFCPAIAELRSFCETVNDPDYVWLTVLRRLCRAAGLEQRDWRRQLLGYIARFERPSDLT